MQSSDNLGCEEEKEKSSMLLCPWEESDEAKLLASLSELHEYLAGTTPLALSRSSYNVGNIRSTLVLPLPTNDISESGSFEDSYVFPFLVNGDLSRHIIN